MTETPGRSDMTGIAREYVVLNMQTPYPRAETLILSVLLEIRDVLSPPPSASFALEVTESELRRAVEADNDPFGDLNVMPGDLGRSSDGHF